RLPPRRRRLAGPARAAVPRRLPDLRRRGRGRPGAGGDRTRRAPPPSRRGRPRRRRRPRPGALRQRPPLRGRPRRPRRLPGRRAVAPTARGLDGLARGRGPGRARAHRRGRRRPTRGRRRSRGRPRRRRRRTTRWRARLTVWDDKSLCVVLPTYNEKDSIAAVIRGFEDLGVVDDILVVNNNAAPGTSEEVATTSAREVHEPVQGYGAAIMRGLREARTDLICVCEPD